MKDKGAKVALAGVGSAMVLALLVAYQAVTAGFDGGAIGPSAAGGAAAAQAQGVDGKINHARRGIKRRKSVIRFVQAYSPINS